MWLRASAPSIRYGAAIDRDKAREWFYPQLLAIREGLVFRK
jgi:hypothetical protein